MEDQLNELETLKAQSEEYLSGWKRAQADYVNLKKETERQRIEFSKYANEKLLDAILPVFDQLERAIGHAPPPPAGGDVWAQGINAIHSMFQKILEENGVEFIQSQTEFDPHLHEAVGHEPSETVPEGQIVRTVERGYSLNGKLLKPAKVIISK